MSTFTFTATYPQPETAELVSELITVQAANAREAEAKVAALVFGVNAGVDGWLELS